MRHVDLRSDTVTRPSPAMRAAMAAAEVGDDVFGEDPTVNRLQSVMAERLGKEAALFVSSGTQSNLLALMSHCERGDEYIAGQNAHAYRFEGGGGAVLGSIQPQPVPMTREGLLPLDDIRAAIKMDDFHFAKTRLVCIENTYNGHPLPLDYIRAVGALCQKSNLGLHKDGARLFNAVVATAVEAAELVAPCDSISVCLSKGLAAPVGSLLVGSKELIDRARRIRKMLGGGMRQAGVLAAAGLHALEHHVDRLREDHERASIVAAALSRRFQGRVEQNTNMIFLLLPEEELRPFLRHMNNNGITIHRPRWVMHRDINDEDLMWLLATIERYPG
jgi:threonine aldolase